MERKIKVIEAFAGYGSQSMALKNIGFELSSDSAIIEWTVDAIIANAAAHHPEEFAEKIEVVRKQVEEKGKQWLADGMSSQYTLSTEKKKGWIINGTSVAKGTKIYKDISESVKKETLTTNEFGDTVFKKFEDVYGDAGYVPLLQADWRAMNTELLIQITAACVVTKNLGSIMDVKGNDPRLLNTDIFTYSFPCQDLSLAGKGKGIKEGTRSGLLFEVERILEEQTLEQRPKVLLLENVKALVTSKHSADFERWLEKLDELGYTSTWKVLNAKNYNIPQNRERVFVLSWKKDSNLDLDLNAIKSKELTNTLKNYLDDKVDEKFYLTDEHIQSILNWNAYERPLTKVNTLNSDDVGKITTKSGDNTSSQKLVIPEVHIEGTKINVEDIFNGKNIIIGINHSSPKYKSDNAVHGGNFIISTLRAGGTTQLVATEFKEGEDTYGTKQDGTSVWTGKVMSGKIINDGKDMTIILPESEFIRIAANQNTTSSLVRLQDTDEIAFRLPDGSTKLIGYDNKECKWFVPISNDPTKNFITCEMFVKLIEQASLNVEVIIPLRIRKITPIEALRLMGVSDNYINNITKYITTQSAQYKLAGNSIVVNVLEEIFTLLKGKF